jgi:hypothetical protein
MPKATKRAAHARAVKTILASPAPAGPVDPKVTEITPEERKRLVGRIGFGKFGPGMFNEAALPTVERPTWVKGFTDETKIPYAILRCTCNTDTVFELRGDGKAPKPNCCTNAPAYPQDAAWQEHLNIFVSQLDAAGLRKKMDGYDRFMDEGGRARLRR